MTLAGKFPDIMSGGGNMELADLKLLLGICAAAVAVGVAASGADGNPATGATEIQMKGALTVLQNQFEYMNYPLPT